MVIYVSALDTASVTRLCGGMSRVCLARKVLVQSFVSISSTTFPQAPHKLGG